MMKLFHDVSQQCSKITAEKYSTSFSTAIRLLHPDLRTPVYNIYGFVRFADEIVDTFHAFDKATLLKDFKRQTYEAISDKISLNPILNSFQMTVNKFSINLDLVEAFFESMQMDLEKRQYDCVDYEAYIYGSAEVVGLMCLYVFCEGNTTKYEQLKPAARSLGAAFQKVNFLRDLKADFVGLKRVYFPGCDFVNFTEQDKHKIETDIQQDFSAAYKGILHLPLKAKFGVYVAYQYYYSLFRKIKKTRSEKILEERIRINNYGKVIIVAKAGLKNQLNLL